MPSLPITPPTTDADLGPRGEKILSTASHVLSTEAAALSCISQLYATDPLCRSGFVHAVEALVESQERGGQAHVIGVGKSGKIGDKLVASMNSLGIVSSFLSPVDALHGDLGKIRKNDVLLLITFSGKTPELLQLLPHLPAQLPLIVLTSHTSYHTCPLIRDHKNAILLPTPIPESEVDSFGVAAPTTSTTVALALGDALTLVAADALHGGSGLGSREVFRRNHPGGAIGIANMILNKGGIDRIRALAVRWADIPIADTQGACYSSLTVLDCLRMAVKSPKGWLRTADDGVIPPRKLLSCQHLCADVYSPEHGLVVDVNELIKFSAETPVSEVAAALYPRRSLGEIIDETAIVVVEDGKVHGLVEVGDVIERAGL
ncbi:hypothetical protein FN846DRAFT_896992 [Sphaerosporella brunnea]|uniref:SIS domain-containing protein n=1 Tax=Sphaerosporella brunnea TaxID=1250544 RepID=A0A5J5FAG3_9PEZI|nr:hypothetical protein FN846DRAFT_896992 [Sphaerosporella brunnea]